MMHERGIREDWVVSTVHDPDKTELREEDEVHYLKRIPQEGGKTLRVILNPSVQPEKIVTVFFDRRVQL
jgi:hypothetical protein